MSWHVGGSPDHRPSAPQALCLGPTRSKPESQLIVHTDPKSRFFEQSIFPFAGALMASHCTATQVLSSPVHVWSAEHVLEAVPRSIYPMLHENTHSEPKVLSVLQNIRPWAGSVNAGHLLIWQNGGKSFQLRSRPQVISVTPIGM